MKIQLGRNLASIKPMWPVEERPFRRDLLLTEKDESLELTNFDSDLTGITPIIDIVTSKNKNWD